MSDLTLVLGPTWSRFAKRWYVEDGEFKAEESQRLPLKLELEDAQIDGIQDLLGILDLLRGQRNTCVIRGRVLPGVEQPCRRLTKPRTENGVHYEATIEDVPRRWLMIDFDSVDAPLDVDFTREPHVCAEHLRALLPPEFRASACVWQASGSAGFKPGVRLHLWFLLDRPLTGDECKAWLSTARVKFDRTLFGAVQPHFTADPELDGVPDPMSQRIGMLTGGEFVPVPDALPTDTKKRERPQPGAAEIKDSRPIDPFLAKALRQWEAANPSDSEIDLGTRFECPACGSSDGCAWLPDGKLFCHGDKHARNAPNIGHAAANGYVMHRFEAENQLEWTQVIPKLQELGLYPGIPKLPALTPTQTVAVDDAVEEMSAAVEGAEFDMSAAKRAQRELKAAVDLVRTDPTKLEDIAYTFARRFVPGALTADAVRDALLNANMTTRNAGAALLDVHAEAAVDRGLERARQNPIVDQPSALSRDKFGSFERCTANVVKLLNLDEFVSVLGLDVRSGKKCVLAPPPWSIDPEGTVYPRAINDTDYSLLTVYLADRHEYPYASTGQIADGIASACEAHMFDPVVDYLDALDSFDGTIDEARAVAGCWLVDFAGCEDSPYTRAVAMRWLISAVARAYNPGCQVREVLTLIGPQNVGKSQLMAALCARAEWFKDDLHSVGTKDAAMALLGKWIVELAEIDKLVATDRHGLLKAFISTQVDNYRPPYGRETVDVRRRSVFVATGNPDELFRDPTGNSRFNVVRVPGEVDVAGARAARDELWSAARMLFKAGEPWWLQADEVPAARAMQEAHREVSDAEALLQDLVDSRFRSTTPAEFPNGKQFETDEGGKRLMWAETTQLMEYIRERGVSRGLSQQVAAVMRRLGWEYARHVNGDKKGTRGFRRPN